MSLLNSCPTPGMASIQSNLPAAFTRLKKNPTQTPKTTSTKTQYFCKRSISSISALFLYHWFFRQTLLSVLTHNIPWGVTEIGARWRAHRHSTSALRWLQEDVYATRIVSCSAVLGHASLCFCRMKIFRQLLSRWLWMGKLLSTTPQPRKTLRQSVHFDPIE